MGLACVSVGFLHNASLANQTANNTAQSRQPDFYVTMLPQPSPHSSTVTRRDPNLDKAALKLASGQFYLDQRDWKKALENCDAAMQLADKPDASICIREALKQDRENRRVAVYEDLNLAERLIESDNFDAVATLFTNLQKYIQQDEGLIGPLPNNDQAKIREKFEWYSKARKQKAEFPPDWSRTVSLSAGIVLYSFALISLASALLYLMRKALQRYWRFRDKPRVRWRVWSISDKTEQRASGAVMDALNRRFNPLFRELMTSSLLALPPSFHDEHVSPNTTLDNTLRNFLVSERRVRPLASLWLEVIPSAFLANHFFEQVEAFEEEMTVKVGGFFEGNIATFFRVPDRWFHRGLPAISGSVSIEEIAGKRHAVIRLVGNWDKQARRTEQLVIGVTPGHLLSRGETLSVYASTEIQAATDAIALAAQRAAFRFLYRIAVNFDQPNLAIAASSYIQGVRLLEHYLI